MIHAISSQYQSIIMSLFLLIFSLSPSLSGLVVCLGLFCRSYREAGDRKNQQPAPSSRWMRGMVIDSLYFYFILSPDREERGRISSSIHSAHTSRSQSRLLHSLQSIQVPLYLRLLLRSTRSASLLVQPTAPGEEAAAFIHVTRVCLTRFLFYFYFFCPFLLYSFPFLSFLPFGRDSHNLILSLFCPSPTSFILFLFFHPSVSFFLPFLSRLLTSPPPRSSPHPTRGSDIE